ncbi:MAG: hypothetical protein ABSE73_09315 [Planctomycetota bacterium]
MKHLHVLPRFSDRWSHLYLEHGKLGVAGTVTRVAGTVTQFWAEALR